MAQVSKIEWTDSTFNPWIGCTKVSPRCQHCYAEKDSLRRGWAKWGKGKLRKQTKAATWKQPLEWNAQAAKERKRKRVFCASLADVFDAEVENKWREELWKLIGETPLLDWLVLTKRPENIRKMLPQDWGDGWPNVCLMTSVEDQLRAVRIEHLTSTPAKYRALSVEPLLGPVKLEAQSLKKLDWVIVGGESGGHARPMHPQWARDIRDQCEKAGVKFLFKQWGCWSPDESFARKDLTNVIHFADASDLKPTHLNAMGIKERRAFFAEQKEGTWMFRTSKTESGNLLDGRQHLEHPFGKKITASEILLPLDANERKRLKECEDIIRSGLVQFVEVGTALMEIRDSRLYRGTHGTFEEYVNAVLSLTRPHAYRLMDGAQVIRDLSPIGDISILPTNEAQARELARLKTPEERIAAWRKVIDVAGKKPITAKLVHETLTPRAHAPRDGRKARETKIRTLVKGLRNLFDGHPKSKEAEPLLARIEKLLA